MTGIDLSKLNAKSNPEEDSIILKQLLTKYLNPAFGALPKLEVELLFLDALIELGCVNSEPTAYELTTTLRVTRAKAYKLLYERQLRRFSREELERRVKELLANPIIRKSGDAFQLAVENPLVSDHLRDKARRLGFVTDGSFSPSIVQLPVDGFVALVEDILGEKTGAAIATLQNAGAPDKTMKGLVRAATKKLAYRIAAESGEAALAEASNFFGSLINGEFDRLADVSRVLFGKADKN
jgi:hypothetical protein